MLISRDRDAGDVIRSSCLCCDRARDPRDPRDIGFEAASMDWLHSKVWAETDWAACSLGRDIECTICCDVAQLAAM